VKPIEWVNKMIPEYRIGSFAEIGVWNGDLMDGVKKVHPGIFYLMVESVVNDLLMKRIGEHRHESITLFAMYSVQAASLIADGSLGMVYIDAEHSYQSVKEDILLWRPKIKKGGILAGHDYNKVDGQMLPDGETKVLYTEVWRAVDDLIPDVRLEPEPSHYETPNNHIWWTVIE
jgi:hypothetical protein